MKIPSLLRATFLATLPLAGISHAVPTIAGGNGSFETNTRGTAAFDDNPHTFWSPGRDEEVASSLYGKTFADIKPDRPLWLRESWLAVDLQKPKTVTRMVLGDGYAPVKEWKVEYEKDGQWHEVVKGTTIGQNLEVTLPQPVTAQKFRLSLKADNRTAIREWQMF